MVFARRRSACVATKTAAGRPRSQPARGSIWRSTAARSAPRAQSIRLSRSPCLACSESSPDPPNSRSPPFLPLITSPPARPRSRSAPGPPRSRSFADAPAITSAPLFPRNRRWTSEPIGRTTESLPLPPVPTSCPGWARSVANTSSPAPRKASNPPSLGKSHRARVESIAMQPKPSSGNGSFAALTPAGSVITIVPSDWTSVSIALSASPPTIRTPPCSEKTALPGNAGSARIVAWDAPAASPTATSTTPASVRAMRLR